MDHVTAEFVEKPDVLPWFDDIEGEVNTFAFSEPRPTIDNALMTEGGTEITEE